MTTSEKTRAAKKADTALCKLQDLFSGYNIPDAIATRVSRACDSVREIIYAIENTEAKRKAS